ncbi:MAG: hypothetical protein V1744_04120 [Candidatus Altiarchaeota archaeon]
MINPRCRRCGTSMDLVPLGMRDNKWYCPKCKEVYENNKWTRRP